MNSLRYSCVIVFVAFLAIFSTETFAQDMQRPRIVQTIESQSAIQTSQPSATAVSQVTRTARPTLTNEIKIYASEIDTQPLVKKTSLSAPANAAPVNSAVNPALLMFNQRLSQSMDSKLGIPYRYGATGLNSIDCSGLVWMVFRDAGITFERTSAVNYWREFEPVSGDDRFEFGTLVFFNELGHVGIVVNDRGFYHASSSKGVTYSSFDGYWAKRIVGYRRIPVKNS